MYKFDVKYTLENYLEYYKYSLFRSKIFRDLIFMIIFVAFGVFFLVDQSEATAGTTVPILAIVMGVLFPLMNVITLPILKKQLHSKQNEIDRTHIVVTFNDEEVIYENLTVKETPVEEEAAPEENAPEKDEEQPLVESESSSEPVLDEAASEEVVSADEETAEEATDEEKENSESAAPENENVFALKYSNFQKVLELDHLFLFYLDRQTVIILPKDTFIGENSFDHFKEFIVQKIDPKRVRFKKTKQL